MRHFRLVLSAVILSTLLVAALPQRAYACSCMAQTTRDSYYNADLVFAGEIVDYINDTATFSVNTGFKGVEEDFVEVSTASDSAACGLNFTEFKEWVIFADQDETGSISANLCSGSFNFASSQQAMTTAEAEAYNELVDLAAAVDELNEFEEIHTERDYTVLYYIFAGVVAITLLGGAIYIYRKGRK